MCCYLYVQFQDQRVNICDRFPTIPVRGPPHPWAYRMYDRPQTIYLSAYQM